MTFKQHTEDKSLPGKWAFWVTCGVGAVIFILAILGIRSYQMQIVHDLQASSRLEATHRQQIFLQSLDEQIQWIRQTEALNWTITDPQAMKSVLQAQLVDANPRPEWLSEPAVQVTFRDGSVWNSNPDLQLPSLDQGRAQEGKQENENEIMQSGVSIRPVETQSGRQGLVCSCPIPVGGSIAHIETYLDLTSLFSPTLSGERSAIEVALLSESGAVLLGAQSITALDPVTASSVGQDIPWRMAIAPSAGWSAVAKAQLDPARWLLTGGFTLIFLIVYLVLRRQEKMLRELNKQRSVLQQEQNQSKLARDKQDVSEKMFSLLSDHTHTGAWHYAIPDQRWYWSEEIYALFGLSPESFKPGNESIAHLLENTGEAEHFEFWRKAMKNTAAQSFEMRTHHRDGSPLDLRITMNVRADSQGNPTAYLGLVQDITAEKAAHNHLLQVSCFLALVRAYNLAWIRAEDERQLLDEFCRVLVERGGISTGMDRPGREGSRREGAAHHLSQRFYSEPGMAPAAICRRSAG